MIKSTFNNQLNILKTELKGDITAQDIIDYLVGFRNNISYPRKLKTLSDTCDANFKFSFKDLKSFNTEKNKSLKNYDIVVSAVVINSPATAALATLYQAIANNKKYKIKVFSTHEAAVTWIDSYHF